MICAKVRRMIGDAREDHPRVAAHLGHCPACRKLASDQTLPGRVFREVGPPEALDRLRVGLAASVLARLPREAPVPARAWLRPAAVAAAAGLALLAILVAVQPLIPGAGPGPERAQIASAAGLESAESLAAGSDLRVQRLGDSVEILLGRNGDHVHQVAVSTSPDFTRQRVTRFRGTRWVDPAPAPIVGGVVFYRID